jgi:hypothetical protein
MLDAGEQKDGREDRDYKRKTEQGKRKRIKTDIDRQEKNGRLSRKWKARRSGRGFSWIWMLLILCVSARGARSPGIKINTGIDVYNKRASGRKKRRQIKLHGMAQRG